MKEHPILFSGPMVRAILEGRKTMTRRIVRWPAWVDDPVAAAWHLQKYGAVAYFVDGVPRKKLTCPYGQPGDRLWVRETFAIEGMGAPDDYPFVYYQATPNVCHQGDGVGLSPPMPWPADSKHKWKPSIHMPRWASRITLEVTGVRVERLQSISEADAQAEGVEPLTGSEFVVGGMPVRDRPAAHAFFVLWENINADRAPWSSNPWVWVVSFRRAEQGGEGE